jgi:phage baseplate assembly protein gpV
VDIKGPVQINSTGQVDITATKTKISGLLEVAGTATFAAGVIAQSFAGPSGGAAKVADLEATGDVKAGSVSLKNHRHTSAASGSPTSEPLP